MPWLPFPLVIVRARDCRPDIMDEDLGDEREVSTLDEDDDSPETERSLCWRFWLDVCVACREVDLCEVALGLGLDLEGFGRRGRDTIGLELAVV